MIFDIDSIPFGGNFAKITERSLRQSNVVFVTIDDEWLVGRQGQRPLNDLNDWVRREIEIALEQKLPIIPLLIGDARMPIAEELPDNMRGLGEFQALRLRVDEIDADLGKILAELERRSAVQKAQSPRFALFNRRTPRQASRCGSPPFEVAG